MIRWITKLLAGCCAAMVMSGLVPGAAQAAPHVEGELVAGLVEEFPIDSINALFGTTDVQHLPQLHVYQLSAPSTDLDSLAAEIAAIPEVTFCHPNYLVDPLQPVQGSIPFGDDEGIGSYVDQPAAGMLNLDDAHDFALGDDVTVAVIDGGVNYQHPVLSGVVASGWDYVDDDPDAFDEPGGENTGHGTFVAGVVHLVAPDADIRAYRVTDTAGESNGYVVAEAILQAVVDGCRVINLSMVMTAEHSAIHSAIQYARDNDVLVIVAAGNGQGEIGGYPATDTNAIAVAAVDSIGVLAEFSNFGDYVDLCAPGVEIYAPYLDSGYAWWGGTSFSAPFVAAQAALLISMEPSLSWSGVLNAILATAVNIDSLNEGFDGQLGAGFIDPVASLLALLGSGITLHVPSEYSSIQEAINAAFHGDTILVAPGTYQGSLNFQGKSLKLLSEQGAEFTTIRPSSPHATAVSFYGSYLPGIEIQGFTFTGAGGRYSSVIRVNGASPLIAHNIFRDNIVDTTGLAYAIELENSSAIVTRNLFFNNGAYGSVGMLGETDGCRVYNNTFDSNRNGIYIQSNESYQYAFNNIITDSKYVGANCFGSGSSAYWDYNNVWNNTQDYRYTSWIGDNDISSDPLYVNPKNHDYRLLPGSPCIDSGDPDPAYNDPDGSRADMGCYPVATMTLPLPVWFDIAGAQNGNVITTLTPTFEWTYYDTATVNQVNYELEVGTDDNWDVAELWATGMVPSSDTSVLYAGTPLSDLSEYYVRVRVHNGSQSGEWYERSFRISISSVINVPANVATVQGAIDFALDGDTVVVAPGLYVEALEFNGNSIVLKSSDGPNVTTLQAPNSSQTTITLFNGEDSTTVIEGFTIQNGFINVAIAYGARPRVIGSRILNGASCGLWAWESFGLLVENNYFEGNRSALRVDDGSESIRGNTFVNNGSPEGSYYCVYLRQGTGTEFVQNVVARNSSKSAVYVTQGSDIAIRNNTIYGNSEAGIDLLWARSLDIRNNIIAFHYGGSGIRDHDYNPGSSPVIEYNNFFENYPVNLEGFTAGTGCVFADPLFADTTANEFGLLAGSPCIDAGDPDPVYNDPDSTRNDMGANPKLISGFPLASNISFAPLGPGDVVASLTPDISWTYLDTSATTQAQYEIEVGTDNDWVTAEMWASGPAASSTTTATYAGSPLTDFTTYYVRIRVNDGFTWGEWSHAVMTVKTVAVIYVPADVPTIGGAISVARDGDSILVAPGTYIDSAYFQGKRVVVTSTGGPDVTFLEPPSSYARVFTFSGGEDTTSVVDGFTFQNGHEYIWLLAGSNGKVTNNRFFNATSYTVVAEYNNNLVLRNNLFDGNRYTMYGAEGTYLIQNNTAINTPAADYNGVFNLNQCRQTEFSYNLIANNALSSTGTCVDFAWTDSCLIFNNTIVNNICTDSSEAAIKLTEVADFRVFNNIVAFNHNMYGIRENYSQGGSIFEYNDVYGNESGDYFNAAPGAGSNSVDPLFLDTAALDYSLTSGSPCIDAGNPSLEYLDPDGTRNDMGAIPFNGITDPPVPLYINMSPEDLSHVVDSNPTIYWSYYDTLAPQAAFEIEIGTDDNWSVAEMWSTGVVNSSDTSIVYAGNPLEGGTDYYLRMRVNNGSIWGGRRWGIFHKNGAPSGPTPLRPVAAATSGLNTRLVLIGSSDPENDDLSYTFEVYADGGLTQLVATVNDATVDADTVYSEYISGLEHHETYWWRAQSTDGFEPSGWTSPESFFTVADIALAQVSGQLPGTQVYCDGDIEFTFRITNSYEGGVIGLSNGFAVSSPDGAAFTTVGAKWHDPGGAWASVFDGWYGVSDTVGGPPVDTAAFGAFCIFSDGFQPADSRLAFNVKTTVPCSDTGKTICIDSTFFAPAGSWLWAIKNNADATPSWDGPHCFTIAQCCFGMRGNVNGDTSECDVADLSCLVDYLFRGGPAPLCPPEANIDGDPNGQIIITDLTYLVDYLFKGGNEPLACEAQSSSVPLKLADNDNLSLLQIVAEDSTVIALTTDRPLRGLQIILTGGQFGNPIQLIDPHIEMEYHRAGSLLTVGIVDLEGDFFIPEGETNLLRLPGKFAVFEAMASDVNHRAIILQSRHADKPVGLPEKFALHQNYPNPFNPQTVIRFDLPRQAEVELEIFNILGQRVKMLKDEEMEPGRYEVVWNSLNDGSKLVASGVYFYRLTAGDFVDSKKMLLLK